MTGIWEPVIAGILVIGGVFGLIGSFGLWKLRDPIQRLHAPTKASTVGVGAALLASVLDLWVFRGQVTWQELLVVVFLFLTAPVSALFLAKVHLHQRLRPDDLPATGRNNAWMTYTPDGDDRPGR